MDHDKKIDEQMENSMNIERDPASDYGLCTLSFVDVGYSVMVRDPKDKLKKIPKVILEPCTGHFKPGELVAIMGPSGSGKSTLLDIIAGRKSSTTNGQVYLNGHPIDSNYPLITGFVPQQDIMPAFWTVREALTFNSELLMPWSKNESQETKDLFIEKTLQSLGLDGVANTIIGNDEVRGISGGQKRRVTLGRGFVSGYHILFCDEPTSGLSATDAEICVKRMHALCKTYGITMIVVIHQPRREVAKLFDKLLLLTSNPGRVVYNGPMAAAANYWTAAGFPVPPYVNPVDHYLDLVTPSYTKNQVDLFVALYEYRRVEVEKEVITMIAEPGLTSVEVRTNARQIREQAGPVKNRDDKKYKVGYGTQLKIVFNRQITLMKRNFKGVVVGLFLSMIIKALVLGIAFYNVGLSPPIWQMSFIFLSIQMSAMSTIPGMASTIKARTLMKMETSMRLYSEITFMLSIFLTEFVLNFVGVIVFLLILYPLGGMLWSHFGTITLWLVLSTFAMDSLFQLIASIAKNEQQSFAISIPILFLFVLFNGYFVLRSNVMEGMMWAIDISPFYHAINEIASSIFSDGVPATSPHYLESGQYVIDLYGFQSNSYSLWVLLCYIVGFRCFQIIALKKLNNLES